MEKRGWKGETLIKLVSEIPERAQRTNYTIYLRAMKRTAATTNDDHHEDERENEDEVAEDNRMTMTTC